MNVEIPSVDHNESINTFILRTSFSQNTFSLMNRTRNLISINKVSSPEAVKVAPVYGRKSSTYPTVTTSAVPRIVRLRHGIVHAHKKNCRSGMLLMLS